MNTLRTSIRIENIKTNPNNQRLITEMKTVLQKINGTLNDAEECISDLEDRVVEVIQTEQQKEKGIKN